MIDIYESVFLCMHPYVHIFVHLFINLVKNHYSLFSDKSGLKISPYNLCEYGEALITLQV